MVRSRRRKTLPTDYWNTLWGWYDERRRRHVAAYLAELDISDFDPKAPPPKTAAFWAIVDANRAPEDAELADVLDKLGNPDAVTLDQIIEKAGPAFAVWLRDHRNHRQIPFRFEQCGYVRFTTKKRKDRFWLIGGERQAVYVLSILSVGESNWQRPKN